MIKKLLLITITGLFIISFDAGNIRAGEVDILIDKLVEKNILTQSEATMIMEEMRKEEAKQKEEIKEAAEDAVEEGVKDKFGIPDWIENTKYSGDIRVRYQGQDTDNDGKPSRDRGRVRLRAGFETAINDQWKAGFGLASGSDDPISTNQTLDSTFSTKNLNLDLAYAKYTPNDMLSIVGGKFKNPIYTTKDLIWDSDTRPEGLAASINYEASENLDFFVTPAFFILEEYKTDKDDPFLLLIQPGANWKINDNTSLKFALAYYDFQNVKGSDLNDGGDGHSQETNSRDADGNWAYDHDSIAFDAELGVTLPSVVPYASLFGQYVVSDADDSVDMDGYDDNTGWLLGFKLGDKSVKGFGDWQFKYNYREIEKDAWVDFLPDSDFYDGQTGVKGSEFEIVLGLSKNITFGLDYYMAEPIRCNIGEDQSLLQADLILKW